MMLGIGGSPEGVIAACALKCVEGDFQGRLWPRNDDDRRLAAERGIDLTKVLTIDDLVTGDDVFFAATGVTGGDLLEGVEYIAGGATSANRWSCAPAPGPSAGSAPSTTGGSSRASTPP